MPCPCPIEFNCCNIGKGDIGFVISYGTDKKVLDRMGIKTIDDLNNKFSFIVDNSQEEFNNEYNIFGNEEIKSNDLINKKLQIWRRDKNIGIPLMQIFNS